MRAIVLMAGMTVAMLGAVSAIADDTAGTALSMKRQLVICMNKSMAANRTLSYNDAQRDCKETLSARNQNAGAKRSLTANAADAPALKTP
jgi:hypothetical protein